MQACPLLHPHLPTIIRLVATLDKQVDMCQEMTVRRNLWCLNQHVAMNMEKMTPITRTRKGMQEAFYLYINI